MQLFYTPEIQADHRAFLLHEEESRHAVRVLRMTVGDRLHLVDGNGGLYTTTITDAHPKRTALKILDVHLNHGARPYHLHIAVAPTKNIDRMEWFLEKATEVGIDEITPLICVHSERKQVKTDRLKKVMVAAMKQSLKAFLPKLNEPTAIDDFMAMTLPEKRFIAHCAKGDKRYISDVLRPKERVLVLIGPEGDFSTDEINKALASGFMPTTLGNTRLRTETAALAACVETALINR